MKRWLTGAFLALVIVAFITPDICLCEEMSNYELMEELNDLKARTYQLEKQLEMKGTVSKEEPAKEGGKFQGGAKDKSGLPERVRRIEEQMKEKGILGKWAKRITIGGLIEVEAFYEDFDYDDSAEDDEKSSDISLATVELGIGIDILKHVKGQVLFLYEDGEDIVVDEGIISIDGEDVVSFLS